MTNSWFPELYYRDDGVSGNNPHIPYTRESVRPNVTIKMRIIIIITNNVIQYVYYCVL